jgi:F0F1-type ATP synthase membrane subunit c/vacuolar-type H+-ATPase subunit K
MVRECGRYRSRFCIVLILYIRIAMMKPDQNTEPNIDARYRTMLILWFALFSSIGMYIVVIVVMAPQTSTTSDSPESDLFIIVLTTAGTLLVLASFLVKRSMLFRSVEQQRVELVQQALIIACAMCEASAVLGLVERFLFEGREYYLLFLISAIGIALHFPRREQLLSATYKKFQNGPVS